MTRRRIQPKAALELETVSLRLPAQLVRSVEQYAKYLGGSTDRTYIITQAIEIAPPARRRLPEGPRPQARRVRRWTRPRHRVTSVTSNLHNVVGAGGPRLAPPASSRNTDVFTPTLSATPGGPNPFTVR